jgi:hypothetical protein
VQPGAERTKKRRFQLIFIKPSHYDADRYMITWYSAMIPSNSLAALYGIADDCVRARGSRTRGHD